MKKIYIAGKVSGLSIESVLKKFANAQEEIEDLGFKAINPISVVNDWACDWHTAMKLCIKALMDCDAIVVLNDYTTSDGAKIELELSKRLGITIFYGVEELAKYTI
ncbi:hypothetical protein B0A58_07330 [Flavobacterium branchiophilum NBRC 15030 = ATCC 35035]|uniref:Uncharacterized protein DUF4406 n=1 Tax=Flavobacterium branchiophilum TaxID=55197 RepID=A0A543G155_9FLAO|nr:DUF4406 domain-containing protein [Flavobacterium branchiophilum]OXA76377.1 hypothetical protein B0A58_07330 [Flavobacterium branchiophilum NBRC 15030 = ATCC 35035]TQM39801.1 uncharacterized protein DUF4406 [Flavobacterium branchiophilum]GEM55263.1 phage protein [Flavobacterium branchiophilum NBRC 15030 = ATCC 35035]